jgi:hypothetical protein
MSREKYAKRRQRAMKYLIMAKPGGMPVPRERFVELYQAAQAWFRERLADGRMDCVYVFADAGGMAISNADTHDQVFAELISYPLYGNFVWEVQPLCDWDAAIMTILELASAG